MPPPSKIDLLPPETREELDRRLVANGFGGLVGLSEWLSEQGFEISKTSVGVRAQRLKQRLAAITASTEAMKMVAAAAPDDADDRSNAIISLVQADMFETLVEFQEAQAQDSDELSPAERIMLYAKASKGIADLQRAAVSRHRWADEVKRKLDTAKAEIQQIGTRAGISEDTMRAIDARLQGIL